jgi:hypothetical protein
MSDYFRFMERNLTLPTDREVWESDIAQYWFEGGVLIASNKDVYRTLENITSAISMINEITRGKKVPLLILSPFEPEGDVDALDYLYAHLDKYISAIGLIEASFFKRIQSNYDTKSEDDALKTRVFKNQTTALKWLRKFEE